jgi:pimeloyl-ACP methyl ester carboxylesterase
VALPEVLSGPVRIHWEESGQGPPVVLLHGFSETAQSIWVAGGWVDALVGAGRHCVRFDLRGHGHSDAPRAVEDYSAARLVGDLEAVIGAARTGPVDLIGFSLGGEIALRYVLIHGRARVRRAALISLGRAFLRPRARSTGMTVAALRAPETAEMHPLVRKFRARLVERGLDLHAAAALLEGERLPPAPGELERIDVPLLFVSGEREKMVGDAAPLAERVPGARLLHIAGADHDAAVFAPETRAAVLEFLGRVGH